MPITRFLANQAFELEVIESMSAAFVAACDALQLKVGKDPATRFVAEKVIKLAQCSVRDPFQEWFEAHLVRWRPAHLELEGRYRRATKGCWP